MLYLFNVMETKHKFNASVLCGIFLSSNFGMKRQFLKFLYMLMQSVPIFLITALRCGTVVAEVMPYTVC